MNHRHVLAATMAIALVSLAAMASIGTMALAKSGGVNDMKKQMAEEQQERMEKLRDQFKLQNQLEWRGLGANFAYLIALRANNSLQAFALKVHYEGVPTITVAMVNASREDGNLSAASVAGVLRVIGVQEYVDTNGDGIYTPGTDTNLTWVNFAQLDWALTTEKVTNGAGTTGWSITMTATSDGATYTIRTQVYNTGINLPDGTPLAPDEAKVDFIILGFPYSNTGSRLALITQFGGMEGSLQVTHVDNQTEAVVNRNAFAYFTWASTAMVDGVAVPVTSSSQGSGAMKKVELNYPHGTNITHDPVVGVGSGSTQDIPSYQAPTASSLTSQALPGIYYFAASAIVVLGVATLALVSRRKLVEPTLRA
jgi:hypothetical protein